MDCNKLQLSKTTMSPAHTTTSASTLSTVVECAIDPTVGNVSENAVPMDVDDESDGEIEQAEQQAELEAKKVTDAAAKAWQAVQEAKAAREKHREERWKELEAEKVQLEVEEKAQVEAEREKARLEVAKVAEEAPIVAVSLFPDNFCRSSANIPTCRMKLKWFWCH